MISVVRSLFQRFIEMFSRAFDVRDELFFEELGDIKIGDRVMFKDKVFHPPYYPYYESYKNNIYIVREILEGNHIKLISADLDKNKDPKGLVHADELFSIEELI